MRVKQPVVLGFQIALKFKKCWFFKWRKLKYLEKNLLRKSENQQHAQPTYDAKCGNQTWATLLGGECFHHYAIPVTGTMSLITVGDLEFSLTFQIITNCNYMPVSQILLGRYNVLGNKTIKHQIFCLLRKQVGKEFILKKQAYTHC